MDHNPYSEIRKVPLDYQGIQSSAFSVQIDKGDEYKEVGVVSNNYLLIPNAEVRNITDNLAESTGYDFEVAKTHFDGKKFVYSLFAKDQTREIDVGDTVGLGISAWNSYDGSIAFNIKFMAYRLECLNGMMSKSIFSSFRFKHDFNSKNFKEEMDRANTMFASSTPRLDLFVNSCNRLATTVDVSNLESIRTKYIPDLPSSIYGKILDEYWTDEYKSTAWDFLNASTKILWHKEKSTVADFKHNQYIVDGMFRYGRDNSLGNTQA